MSNKILEHKGFQGSVEFSLENNILFGKILHINDLVSYEADNPKDLQQSFIDAIDDYLETCEQLGTQPDKPFSGTFNVRIGRNLHRELARHAAREDKGINDVVKEAIDCHLHGRHHEVHHHYPQQSLYEADMFIREAPNAARTHLRVVQ